MVSTCLISEARFRGSDDGTQGHFSGFRAFLFLYGLDYLLSIVLGTVSLEDSALGLGYHNIPGSNKAELA